MAELEVIDYPTVAVSLLIERFKDSEDIQKLVTIAAEAAMDLQTTVFDIRERFVLPTATGPELTIIGVIWDEARGLQTDDELKARIYVKISLSISGTISEIKNILLSLYGATFADYVPAYPAGFTISTDADIIQSELEVISSAGVFGLLLPDPALGNYIVDHNDDFIVGADSYPIIDSDA